jgi:hypothetical protein
MGVGGLHRFGAPLLHFERNLVDSVRAIYHSTRVKMHSMSYSKSNRALGNFAKTGRSD